MGVKMNQEQVSELTMAMYKDLFHRDMMNIPVRLNGRLTRALGRLCYSILRNRTREENVDRTGKIEIATELVNGSYNIETITAVIAHELCHYHLYIEGSTQSSDGDFEFEELIKKIGALSTRKLNPTVRYNLVCSCCERVLGNTSSKRQANNYSKRTTVCCKAKISYNTEALEDNYRVKMNCSLPRAEKLILRVI